MDTRNKILSVAQHFVQQRGFNGFSYADIANEVGIRKASIHHYFPSKVQLGEALIEMYTEFLQIDLQRIGASKLRADKKLAAYIDIFKGTLQQGKMCMGGMLASEWQTLDATMLKALKIFFECNIQWLSELLSQGKSDAQLHFRGSAEDQARHILSLLQGAVLVARATGDNKGFERNATQLMSYFKRKG